MIDCAPDDAEVNVVMPEAVAPPEPEIVNADETHAEPLDVKTFPDVPGATFGTFTPPALDTYHAVPLETNTAPDDIGTVPMVDPPAFLTVSA